MNNRNRQLLFASKQIRYHIYIGKNYIGKVESHYHTFHHCTILVQGDMAYYQQGQMLRMKPNDILFTPAGCNHSMYIFTQETKYFCLSFSQELMDEIIACFPKLNRDFSNLPQLIHVPQHETERLFHLLYCLWEEQNSSADSPFQIGNVLALSALKLMIREDYSAALLDHRRLSDSSYAEVLSCIRYIDLHLSENIETEQLLKLATLSQSSLYKAFKLHTGMPVRQYIAKRRIQESLHLMQEGKSVTEAASAIGFQDFSTFYRNFVKYIGISPSEVAKRLNRPTSRSQSDIPNHLKACIGCIQCSAACKSHAITLVNNYPSVDLTKCIRCGECIGICTCGCIPVDPAVLHAASANPTHI